MDHSSFSAPGLPLPKLSLIVGGARSGKSRLAERLVARLATATAAAPIATAEIWDEEMRARIDRHIADRGMVG